MCKECGGAIAQPVNVLYACSACFGEPIVLPNCCKLVGEDYQCLSCIDNDETFEDSATFHSLGLPAKNGYESASYDDE